MWVIHREEMTGTGKTEGGKDRQDGSRQKQLEGERWYFLRKGPGKRQSGAFKEPLQLEVCGHNFRVAPKALSLERD